MPERLPRPGSRSPEFALLGFLYERPDHGYRLHLRLADELGQVWRVSQSQTYNILKRLEAQGFVSATPLAQEKLPARQVLRISAAGRRRFETWMQTPTGASVRAIRLEFITRLYFAGKLFPGSTPGLIQGEADVLRAALTRLEEDRLRLPSGQVFNRLSLELRIQQLRALEDWVIQCRATLGLGAS